MVSKVAVIALVAIIAVPIMLGYAMNLEQVTETEYKTTGESVNVTPLLQTGIEYSYAQADIVQLNSKFQNSAGMNILPKYQSISTNKTSFPISYDYWHNSHPSLSGINYSEWDFVYFECDYSGTGGYLIGHLWVNSTEVRTINYLHSFYYNVKNTYVDDQNVTFYNVTYSYYASLGSNTLIKETTQFSDPSIIRLSLTDSGNFQSDCWIERYQPGYIANNYANISAGFTMTSPPSGSVDNPYLGNKKVLPDYANNIIYTIDLSSINDADYQFNIADMKFIKTTTDGEVKWTINQDIFNYDIYYDQSTRNNTYQLKITADPSGGRAVGGNLKAYPITYDLRYVGSWPDIIGEANYYQNYKITYEIIQNGDLNLSTQTINTLSKTTPKMRLDGATYRAFEYPIISNKSYDPAYFKSNPTTTLNNITQYGTTITFGGNAYNVKDGNITMGAHQIPVNGMRLSSIPNNITGGYDNKIGDTVISNTIAPSTITFGGNWSVNVITTAQEDYQITKTEWKAGEFAWDGIDHNFLIVGLITCLGVFIGCGIYARKSRSGGIIPLMIVTGCAAFVFFIML